MKQEMGKLNVQKCFKDCILIGKVSNKPISASFDICQTFVQIFGTKVLGGFLRYEARNGETECSNML